MTKPEIPALRSLGPVSAESSAARFWEHCYDLRVKWERERAKARAAMRGAIRKSAPKLNAPKPVSKLKNNGSTTPRRKGGNYGRDLSAIELDHAERLLSEGYALSKVAYMLDTTQSSIERGLRARKGAA